MSSTVTAQDPRYDLLRRGKNARFPAKDSDAVARIEVCQNADDVAEALQRIVSAGMRPTVRAGGHCYEDFVVNNPGGAIIDVSMLNSTETGPGGKGPYKVGGGGMLGSVYTELYKKANVTIPGGSCYTVATGGHISGGGYGVLARQLGLSCDYVTAIDICTVEANGKVAKRHIDKHHDADLFRACLGGQGSNFGVITSFYFDTLPTAPQYISNAGVNFPWETMTEEKFIHIVQTYGGYFEKRGKDPDTWPLFTFMGLNRRGPEGSRGGIGISAAMHGMNGEPDLSIPTEFLDLFLKCGDALSDPNPATTSHQAPRRGDRQQMSPCVAGKHAFSTRPWLDATTGGQGAGGGNGNTRGKYKSCYMKKNFTTEEARRIYKHLTREIPGVPVSGIIAVDSYGGATNKPHLAGETAMPQRASVMKLQYQQYWQDPAEDEARIKFFDEMYTDIYSANVDAQHAGTPFHNEYYEGCYINYPDVDMVRYPFWGELYYGTEGLYPFLQDVKKKYDPNNIFHNAMSIRPKA
ncbi:FAD-dependent oxidoreductase [Terriglobus saanensis]|uniref:Berberine/berberine domain protein n=1 Tax=Terriglobus saanensis (strain ATCC BAA-1853 / DSM 23119 / SP1PR4) TaxID=401053 RepID=E8V420_TERSS|nr:FAD-binding oxidoreductase [Terriglobus saanensis]ADV82511.1 Berberine/berberine domain protein [Terriglobus saanensis SP1PR4]